MAVSPGYAVGCLVGVPVVGCCKGFRSAAWPRPQRVRSPVGAPALRRDGHGRTTAPWFVRLIPLQLQSAVLGPCLGALRFRSGVCR